MGKRPSEDLRIVLFSEEHDLGGFTCRVESLNRYLKIQDVRRKANAVFVLSERDDLAGILGYCTVCAMAISQGDVPEAARKHVPRYPLVSATLIGRLTVGKDRQGQRLGAVLLADAFAAGVRERQHGWVLDDNRRRARRGSGRFLRRAWVPASSRLSPALCCRCVLPAGRLNDGLGCADFNGEFKLGDGRYCYSLTVTDCASRYLLPCEALESTREDLAITAFEPLFQERCLPEAIRSDNGVPFASSNALFNLSKLSLWWRRRGHRHRADQARKSAIKRSRRAQASDAEERDDPSAWHEQPATAGALRRFPNAIQRGKAARGPRHEMPCRGLCALAASLQRSARTRIPFARPRRPRYGM